jgi:hypothetical protein
MKKKTSSSENNPAYLEDNEIESFNENVDLEAYVESISHSMARENFQE